MNTRIFGNSVLAIGAVFAMAFSLNSGFSSAGSIATASQESAPVTIQAAPDYPSSLSGMTTAEYFSASGEGRFTASGELVGQ